MNQDDKDEGLANALLEALGQGLMEEPAPEPKVTRGKPHNTERISSSSLERALQKGPSPASKAWPSGASDADSDALTCPFCATENPGHNNFCGSCGVSLETQRRSLQINEVVTGSRDEVDVDVRLVSINEDGSDGLEIPLRYTETIIGRNGDARFPTDAFLSPAHAKLLIKEYRLFIDDLDSLNGTYVRIRDEVKLSPGDCFLMGRQVLRFERFKQTIAPKARAADGTRFMGSPPPGGQYKILQIGIGGIYQNVYCLPESGAVLGREKGDIVFPRDRFMSSRHAQIYPREDGHYYLVDLNSSNGTWIKIWERHELGDGDLIFLGQQLFRVEASDLR